jgi:DNA repair exonuclease SbcCD ATPase subunit
MTTTIPVVLLLVAVSCTAWARTRAPVTEGVTTMKVFVNSWRQSFAAATLAAVLAPASGDTSRTQAAEGEHDVPLVKVEAEKPPHSGEAAKEGHEGAHRELRETPREERKPEARPEREPGREGGDEREAHAREIAQRRAQLQEQATEIRRKLQALRPDQDGDERELKGALERIERQLQELQAPAPNRDRVRARLEELKAAQRQAQEAGRADEAERLGREAHELMRMLEPGPGDRPAGRPEGEEAQRRLQHLRAAIENLRAAGLNDQANALARDAERLARGERPATPEGGRQREYAHTVNAPAAVPQFERSIQELRGQVQELRQQMEEIRQHLKALAEKR